MLFKHSSAIPIKMLLSKLLQYAGNFLRSIAFAVRHVTNIIFFSMNLQCLTDSDVQL